MMFVVAVYDVDQKRNRDVLSFLRTHMDWVQNSVFEGEVTMSELRNIKEELSSIISTGDSVIIYVLGSDTYVEKEVIGTEKGDTERIL